MAEFIKVNDVYINVKRLGEGEPIVFLHGGPGSDHRFFLPHMEGLAADYELIFYDQNGCGQSGEPEEYSMQGEVETLEQLRIQLGLQKINIMGESWGSMLALLYATTYPENVNKIILTAAIGASAEGFTAFSQELEKRGTDEDKERITIVTAKIEAGEAGIGDILEILDPYYVYSPIALRRKSHFEINHQANQIVGEDIRQNYDVKEELSKISHIPILVAQGDHDILSPSHLQHLLLDYIPHAHLHTLKDCGHWTVVEKPDEMKELTRNFMG